MNEQEKVGLEAEMEAEAKATLVDFLDYQQRALAAASRACEKLGTPEFERHIKSAGATSLAGFRLLIGNFAGMAAACKEAGLCGEAADVSNEPAAPTEKPKRKRGMRLRVRVSTD